MGDLHAEHELAILRLLQSDPDISQRQLAEQLGISLGKTNYVLKALFEKGWLKAKNFSRAKSKTRYLYILTPEGAAAKLKLTRQFLLRKEVEYDLLNNQIEQLRAELRASRGSP